MNQSTAFYQLGPLLPYFQDPTVFEIRINRYQQVICDTFSGRILHDNEKITGRFITNLAKALTSANGIGLGAINNVELPDGSRGIICLPPSVIDDTTAIAFRKNISLDKELSVLNKEGIFDECVDVFGHKQELNDDDRLLKELFTQQRREEFLLTAVNRKRTILVAGATGSGKTVLTRALLKGIDRRERVIILEDVHEVDAPHLDEAVYMLYGRDGQIGRVSPTDCLEACMRLTPGRIFMTELRGDAAWGYLQALNTGHPGGLTSTHANSARDAFNRIGLLIKATAIGRMLDIADIMRMLYSTIDVVVFMEKRKIREIYFDPEYKYQCINGNI
ncbi:conjugal transfer protein TraG [Salmonella enterica subsp. enterica serovar Telelkebir]|nr:conjugal transfer protein TraG [Salmonella enterica subsp. enterica serovar Telelkebir]ECB6713975.1 conjugal transfer protein TraG [Salmonella enterica subsp. enterica serovar Hvittingfoss]